MQNQQGVTLESQPYILEHKTVVEESQEKYDEKVNELSKEGYKPSSQFGVATSSCYNASQGGTMESTKYFVQMSKLVKNEKYVPPKFKCHECDKEVAGELMVKNNGLCDKCVKISSEEKK